MEQETFAAGCFWGVAELPSLTNRFMWSAASLLPPYSNNLLSPAVTFAKSLFPYVHSNPPHST